MHKFNRKEKGGFSLIELIVVIAILAVFTIMLAPKLLYYTERSRASSDMASMDEVVNAIQLALADQEIYDELVRFSTFDNISCYVDTNSEANYQRVVTKDGPGDIDQYTFTSDARILDETPFFAAGNMRGVTITFAPNKGSNGSVYDLKQGVVNQYIQASDNYRVGKLDKLYNRLRSTVGDTIEGDSQTYRNSEFTIFIPISTIGGNDANAQDSVKVYGQWSGTNLPEQVSYAIVSDRSIGDDRTNIVVDDNDWNLENADKITVNPGDLNGGGTFDPTTDTGNKRYTAEDFKEDEKGIYAYLVNGDTLVLRNSPREDMSDVTKDYGKLNQDWWQKPWQVTDSNAIVTVDIETPILPTTCYRWFYQSNNLEEIKNMQNLCMDECVSTHAMFLQCYKLKKVDTRNWNTSKNTNMGGMFQSCSELAEVDVSKWDTSNVTDMTAMFYSCPKIEQLDVSNWDTGKVQSFDRMFMSASFLSKTDIDVSGWDTSSCKNMQSMFHWSGVRNLDVSGWNTDNVTTMACMFNSYQGETLDVSNWNTENVTNMYGIFLSCKNVKELDVSGWKTDKVTDIGDMFAGCESVEMLDVGHFNTQNVTNMHGVFGSCKKLKTVDVSNWNTSKVTKMSRTFEGCAALTELDCSNWDTSNVTTMWNIFWLCRKLETVGNIEGWNTENVTDFGGTFGGCEWLKPSWY